MENGFGLTMGRKRNCDAVDQQQHHFDESLHMLLIDDLPKDKGRHLSLQC
ncbi:hypothetical protein [Flagellimonas lutaonensis]|nr:hypothetical protein [Allomuricauda lutaonensis]